MINTKSIVLIGRVRIQFIVQVRKVSASLQIIVIVGRSPKLSNGIRIADFWRIEMLRQCLAISIAKIFTATVNAALNTGDGNKVTNVEVIRCFKNGTADDSTLRMPKKMKTICKLVWVRVYDGLYFILVVLKLNTEVFERLVSTVRSKRVKRLAGMQLCKDRANHIAIMFIARAAVNKNDRSLELFFT